MTIFTAASIHDEVMNDPAKLGYAGKTAQQVADLMNELTRSKPQAQFQRSKLKALIMTRGLLLNIMGSNAPSASLAKLLFSDPDFATIDSASPAWLGLLAALKADNIISQDDIDAISVLYSSAVTRCQELWSDKNSVSAHEITVYCNL
jgi:hypothetical protein